LLAAPLTAEAAAKVALLSSVLVKE